MANSHYEKYLYFRTQADEDDDDGGDDSAVFPLSRLTGMHPTADAAITLFFEPVSLFLFLNPLPYIHYLYNSITLGTIVGFPTIRSSYFPLSTAFRLNMTPPQFVSIGLSLILAIFVESCI